MIDSSLRAKVRLIQVRTRKTIASGFAGGYRSAFKGRGLEFDEVREYTPGDEVRDIDWNVTARTGRLHVRRYVQERQLKLLFAVDVSASADFGSMRRRKMELAAEFCALVAFSALRNNDTVGLLLFSDRIERFVPPAKGSSHALRLLHELIRFQPRPSGTGLAMALGYLGRLMHRRCVVFLVSDFMAENFERPLRVLAKRHDLIAVKVGDPRESELPAAGLVALYDVESGRRVVVDSSVAAVRRAYAEQCARREARLEELFRSAGVDRISIDTGKEYVSALVSFFRARETRR
ncbi:MAG: DUF58 domain-containing protein [Bryobacterales bacterium]|nr:DUF58 domain-containing protein [Bryobacterales bacterium]